MEWTGARLADQPMVEVTTWIDAPPERVWLFVSDIELMPSLSTELQQVTWLDGADAPAVGAKFLGRNKHPMAGEWETTSHIVECEPTCAFAWAIQDPDKPMATWRFEMTPHDGGTQLSQRVQLGPGRSYVTMAIEQAPEHEEKIVFMRLRDFEKNMTATLDGIKQLAEIS
jgi:uncharacterized protein YndB with AHSA1/START domain